MRLLISVSREQRLSVNKSLTEGSNPRPGFFGMVALSALIASLGLVMDSTAIVIGAMLVAPLMTPILGISLALVRRDPVLLGTAVRAEIAGAGIAVLAALLLGLSIPYFEATPEMLSRTQPNLFDLVVALLAGAAGAYALVDERLSPALPGVAISTAIVPPLANAGLGASLGAYQGAWGSFLLFLTNFVSILLSAAVVFVFSGFGRMREASDGLKVGRRLAVAAASVLVVGAFLGVELTELIERRRLRNQIRETMEVELPRYRVGEILRLHHALVGNQVVVLAHVLAPLVVQPRAVKDIEQGLEERLGRPFRLFVRTSLTESVSASGSMRQLVTQTLDGFAVGEVSEESEEILRAEQVVREYLGQKVGIRLERIERPQMRDGPRAAGTFILETAGLRNLRQPEVLELNTLIRKELGEETRLAVVQSKREILNPEGLARWELQMRRTPSPEERGDIESIQLIVRDALGGRETSVITGSVTLLDGGYYGFYEVAGPRAVTPAHVKEIEAEILSRLGVSCAIFVRPVPEAVVSGRGYSTWDELLSEFGPRTRKFYAEETEQILEDWR